MNFVSPAFGLETSGAAGLLQEDDVLPALALWAAEGRRVALVTLVAVEGGSPRFVGAQMAVCEDGRYAGYLSGGCLEQAIALEAKELIERRENRLVRYGRGSPYFDIKLPCGSGLDVFFDCSLTGDVIAAMTALRRSRRPFALVSTLADGPVQQPSRVDTDVPPSAMSARDGSVFRSIYHPAPHLVLFGAGPSVPALCRVASVAGLSVSVWAGDEPTRAKLDELGIAHHATGPIPDQVFDACDGYAAVVLAFHEHAQEPVILEHVLKSPCFYIGVLGNHAVHRARLETLKMAGYAPEVLQRIRAPLGIIPQAKSQATLAFGIITEILAEAKLRGLVG